MLPNDVCDLFKHLGYSRFSDNRISIVRSLSCMVPAQGAHLSRWQSSSHNVLRAWSKKERSGLHTDFPWDPCFKWRWSLKHIGKLRDLLKRAAWERSFQACCAVPVQFTLHLPKAFLSGPPCNVPNDCGRHSTIYIKEISSCPIKIALHSLGTDGTVQRRQPGSNFNTALKNILILMLSLCKYSSLIRGP